MDDDAALQRAIECVRCEAIVLGYQPLAPDGSPAAYRYERLLARNIEMGAGVSLERADLSLRN